MDYAARLPPYLLFSGLTATNSILNKGALMSVERPSSVFNGSYKLASDNKE
jgi:hypothetical protein